MTDINDLFDEAVEDTVAEVDTSDENFDSSLSSFFGLRTAKSELEGQLSQVNKDLQLVEQALVSIMIKRNIQSIRKPGMGMFTLASNPWPKVKDLDGMIEWLQMNGHDGVAKMGINAQTLRSWVREQKEAGAALPPEHLMDDYAGSIVKFTRAK